MESAKIIDPSEYIMSVLTPEERLEIAFRITKEAFKNSTLSLQDVEKAVKKIRRKAYQAKKKAESNH